MRISVDTTTRDHLLRAAAAARYQDQTRRTTVHLSDCLYCLRRAFFEKTGQGEDLSSEAQHKADLTMMLGEAFQAWLIPGVDDAAFRTEYEGIVCTPDGQVVLDSGEVLPLEIKSTRTSSNKVPGYSYSGATLNHYIDQIAGYCLATKTTSGRLAVLYLSGDYKANRNAQLVVYAVEFDGEELVRWGRILSQRAALLTAAMESGLPPPLDDHLPWACGYCPFKDHLCPGSAGRWGQNFSISTEGSTGWIDLGLEKDGGES